MVALSNILERRHALVNQLQELAFGGALLCGVAKAARGQAEATVAVSHPELLRVLWQALVQYGIDAVLMVFFLGRQIVANLLELVGAGARSQRLQVQVGALFGLSLLDRFIRLRIVA